MAILHGDLDFTGSIGNLSAYKMQGIDKTVIRTKSGASRKKIMKAPEFELTRQNASEFGGCGTLSGSIRQSMLSMVPLADYNFTPSLTALAKMIQVLDMESPRGQRSINLSGHRHYLNGFGLNRSNLFDSIVRHSLIYQIDKDAGQAIVKLPTLTPGVNLILNKQYPMFRFMLNLGSVSDRFYTTNGYMANHEPQGQCAYSEWLHSAAPFEAREMEVELPYPQELSDDCTLILSIGIQMGRPLSATVVQPVKYAGCAKVWGWFEGA